ERATLLPGRRNLPPPGPLDRLGRRLVLSLHPADERRLGRSEAAPAGSLDEGAEGVVLDGHPELVGEGGPRSGLDDLPDEGGHQVEITAALGDVLLEHDHVLVIGEQRCRGHSWSPDSSAVSSMSTVRSRSPTDISLTLRPIARQMSRQTSFFAVWSP